MEDLSYREETLVLRRPTREVLALRNNWERAYAALFNKKRTRSVQYLPPDMKMRQFRLWMQTTSDGDVRDQYRKWGRSPEQHIEEEVQRAQEWAEAM